MALYFHAQLGTYLNSMCRKCPELKPNTTVASHLKALVLTLAFLPSLLLNETAHAQIAIDPGVDRIAPGLHLSARIGVGYYGGDLDAVNSDTENTKRAFALDLLYHLTPKLGVVASVQQSNYSRIVDPLDLTSTSLMMRYAPFEGRISPYAQGGFHRTYGGKETGSGPAAGLGLTLAITPKIHFFQEVNANFVGPDIAIDNSEGGSGFDILGFLGGGIRVANIGVKYHKRAKIDKLVYPSEIRSNAPVEFMAKIDKKASQPVIVTWDFGDGVVEKGNPILHSFPHAGVFKVKVFAENSGGTDMKEAEVTVLHGMDRPRISNTTMTPAENRFVPDNANPEEAYALAVQSVAQAEIALENAKRALAAISASNFQKADQSMAEMEIAAAEEGPQPDLVEPEMMESGEELKKAEEKIPKEEMENNVNEEGAVIAVVLGSGDVMVVDETEPVKQEAYNIEPAEDVDYPKEVNEVEDLKEEASMGEAPVAEQVVAVDSSKVEPISNEIKDTIEAMKEAEEKMTAEEKEKAELEPSLEEQSQESEYFVRLDDGWAVVIASKLDFAEARSVMSTYLTEGYNCEIMPALSGDKVVYRITIGQYEDRPEADRMRSEFFKYDIPSDAWLFEYDRSEFSKLWEQP